MAVVFMDIDGTLLKGASCEMRLLSSLLNKGLIGPVQMVKYFAYQLVCLLKYGESAFKRNKAYLKGLRTGEVEAIGAELAEQELPKYFDQRMVERIGLHKSLGDKIVLLTGSPDFMASRIASKVGADGCIAAKMASRHGRFVGLLPEVHPFREEKVRLAEEYCRKNGCELKEAVAYADTRDDLPLLEMVGRAVAVNPDGPLLEMAEKRGWEIIGQARNIEE